METVIVDCHKEVLPYWFKEYLRLELPLVEVRIDQHHDMNHESPALPAREGRQIPKYFSEIMPYILEYTKREINEANFTCPAFHYGIIGAVYHFNPRDEEIEAYGRVSGSEFIDSPKTKREAVSIGGKIRNRILWDKSLTKLRIRGGKSIPVSQKITMEEFRKDIEESSFPVVIGFDLDGIYGIGERKPTEEVLEKRLGRVERVLECVSSPAFACIARSQTPRRYVPREMVDGLQEAATSLIQTIYT
ncbi:Uncharacterised protein [uncultured archaeon]|nr:Uncharacterised protein [uncultured archaeon]